MQKKTRVELFLLSGDLWRHFLKEYDFPVDSLAPVVLLVSLAMFSADSVGLSPSFVASRLVDSFLGFLFFLV